MKPAVLVITKSPRPGRVKTRLCPPLRPEEAARLAAAGLQDTLDAVASVGHRSVVVLDGPVGPWLPEGFEVIAQRGAGLAERLAAAFQDAGAPAVLIGSDTPQVTPALLAGAADALCRPGVDAVLGPCTDGGYWVIGLRRADDRVFADVPMSLPTTGERQLDRLTELGLRTTLLSPLRDVDTASDAEVVALQAPSTRFAAVWRELRGAAGSDARGAAL